MSICLCVSACAQNHKECIWVAYHNDYVIALNNQYIPYSVYTQVVIDFTFYCNHKVSPIFPNVLRTVVIKDTKRTFKFYFYLYIHLFLCVCVLFAALNIMSYAIV